MTDALKSDDTRKQVYAARSVVTLYDGGMLKSPRLAIAHEIEGDILNIAEEQVKGAEKSTNETHKQLQIAIAAFLASAALEDACVMREILHTTHRKHLYPRYKQSYTSLQRT